MPQGAAADPWQIVADLRQEIAASGAETERLRGSLQECEERYALAMRAINEGFYEWDVASGEMHYSPRVCGLVGLPPEELRTMADWTDRIHPADMPEFRKAILAHFKGETEWLETEYRYRYADGTWHWARQHGVGLKDDAGRVYRVVGSTGDITAQKAAEEALREALEQQMATAEVLGVINSSPGDLAPVFDAILEKAHTLCDAAHGHLTIYDGGHFRAIATHGVPPAFTELLREPFRPGLDVADRLLAGRDEFIHIPDMAALTYDPNDRVGRAAAELAGVRTLLIVPLRKEGILLGYITAHRTVVRPFTDKQIALLENFAAQAVIAMENARLLTETRETLEQQTATAEVLQVINASPGELAPVFDAVLERAMRLCQAEVGLLTLREDKRYTVRAARSRWPEFVEFQGRQSYAVDRRTITGRVALERRAVQITDATVDTQYVQPESTTLGQVRSLLGVPLLREGDVVGTLNLARERVEPFSQSQISLMENFAAQAVIAMENARLLTETRGARDDAESALLELKAAQSSLIQAQKMAALGQLTAGIAHEIKNPLNFVNNFASLSVELLDELKSSSPPLSIAVNIRRESC